MITNPIIIIDITGGTVHTVDSLLAAAVPSGSFLVSALNTQLGSTGWQGGGSGTPAWGAIVGTLADQTDLQAALTGKAASSHTHTLSQITDITVTSDMVSIPKGLRPGLYDDLGTPPVGTIFESVNDGHLYWVHRDGSVHLLCDSGGYGGSTWGSITGTLSDQTDLQAELDDKQDQSDRLDDLVLKMATAEGVMVFSAAGGLCGSVIVPTYFRTFMGSSDAATARATLGLTIGSNVQAYDSELQAIAGLNSAADQAPYFTGAGTAALMTVTTAARALLNDANAAEMRTTLGLGIGSNVQAWSQALANIAQTNPATDTIAYNSGTMSGTITACTNIGRGVLGAANAGSARSVIGAVEAVNATSALVSLTPSADTVPYYTGSASAALMTVSAAARSLLDDSTLDAIINTLGAATYTGSGGLVRRDSPTLTGGLTLQAGTYFQEGYGAPAQSRVRRAQGTVGSPTQTGSGQQIGIFGAQGYTNSGTWGAYMCYIAFVSAEAQTATANGGYLEFFTCPTGSATVVSRGRIGANGNWGLGLTSEPTAMLDVNSDCMRLRTAKTPATASSAGNAGDICFDSNYIYYCVATNTWKRAALSSW